MKKIIMFMCLMFATSFSYNVSSQQYRYCQTYQCQQAQQEIQYLRDAIWREKQMRYPNWVAIQQAENRIRYLMTIR